MNTSTFSLITTPRLPRIYADPGMIEQVILNLAVNARDAMPQAGQLMPSMHFGMELDEDAARINPEARAGPLCLSRALRTMAAGWTRPLNEEYSSRSLPQKKSAKAPGLGWRRFMESSNNIKAGSK